MYEPRELIFHEGDEASEFHVICRGKVAIEIFTPDRGPVAIETINTGEVLGWSWLIEPYRWLFDAQSFFTVSAAIDEVWSSVMGTGSFHFRTVFTMPGRIVLKSLSAARPIRPRRDNSTHAGVMWRSVESHRLLPQD